MGAPYQNKKKHPAQESQAIDWRLIIF